MSFSAAPFSQLAFSSLLTVVTPTTSTQLPPDAPTLPPQCQVISGSGQLSQPAVVIVGQPPPELAPLPPQDSIFTGFGVPSQVATLVVGKPPPELAPPPPLDVVIPGEGELSQPAAIYVGKPPPELAPLPPLDSVLPGSGELSQPAAFVFGKLPDEAKLPPADTIVPGASTETVAELVRAVAPEFAELPPRDFVIPGANKPTPPPPRPHPSRSSGGGGFSVPRCEVYIDPLHIPRVRCDTTKDEALEEFLDLDGLLCDAIVPYCETPLVTEDCWRPDISQTPRPVRPATSPTGFSDNWRLLKLETEVRDLKTRVEKLEGVYQDQAIAKTVQSLRVTPPVHPAIVTTALGGLLGAAVKGPVGALLGGFIGIALAPPPKRWFAWSVSDPDDDRKRRLVGPFLLTDKQAIAHTRAATLRVIRFVYVAPVGWVADTRI